MDNGKVRILVADDEDDISESLSENLQLDGYEVTVFNPGKMKTTVLSQHFDVVITDMKMPLMDGFALRELVLRHSPDAQFIIITGFPEPNLLQKVIDLGISQFIPKPFTALHIRYAVLGALRMKQLMQVAVEQDILLHSGSTGLIGASSALREIRQRILEWAPTEMPVLITGESGTGKEVVARCLHQFSSRSDKRFTALNCASLSPHLIESELFGHAQGAFTGAQKTRHGFFEVTDKGTIFLDEIGELPLELQSKLLRILDRGELTRVGDTETVEIDVRVISATNRDIEEMVAKEKFRADLYYRLRGSHIRIPALRDRKDDIPALIRFFMGDDGLVMTPEAMLVLCDFDWPGNVRELRMMVKSLKSMTHTKIITGDIVRKVLNSQDNSPETNNFPTYHKFRDRILRASERSYFDTLLQSTSGNISLAARYAGMDRKNFYSKLDKLKVAR